MTIENMKAAVRRSCTTNIDIGGGSRVEENRVIASIRIGAARVTLTNVFIVDELMWGSGTVDGTVWLSPDAVLHNGSGQITGVERCETWTDFHKKIKDAGLLLP